MLDYASLARVARAGGFTVNLAGEAPEHGYAVSYPDCERRIASANFRPEHLRAFVADYAPLLSLPNHYLGAWRDGSDIVLDVSAVVTSHADALRAEVWGAQEAIYDLDHARAEVSTFGQWGAP